jgi:hypothetical protein
MLSLAAAAAKREIPLINCNSINKFMLLPDLQDGKEQFKYILIMC